MSREERAKQRHNWPGGLVQEQTPAQATTPEERLASMWTLALDAWAMMGKPLPDYDRANMPGRVIRR